MLRLSKNKNIEIKPADKGGSIVIMKRSDYEQECLRQLRNKEHYARTGIDLTPTVTTTITNYIRLCKKQGTLPEKVADHLIPKSPRTALFYTLPKYTKLTTQADPSSVPMSVPQKRSPNMLISTSAPWPNKSRLI